MIIPQSATVLIVDDIPENVSTLFHLLDSNHFEILVAQDGESALQIAESENPQIILLDIMMPGIDGFETCRRLKASSTTQDIPVIFMTALSDLSSKVRGFELGAVDYVTKPIQQQEVLARINTHLTLQNLQQQLKTKNIELETKNTELEEKNTELEAKNAELNAFSHTVAHDLKNPISDLMNMSEVLLEDYADHLDAQGHQCLQHISNSCEQMINIINALLLLARISTQEIELVTLDMDEILYHVQQRLATMQGQYHGEITLPEQWPKAIGYAPWIEQVWTNYLSNGLKYGGQPPRLEVGAHRQDDQQICFWVRDNGPGLNPEAVAQLFMPFTRLSQTRNREGHGLGLSIVQRIVEKLGGQVGVESQVGQGSLFYFTLHQDQ